MVIRMIASAVCQLFIVYRERIFKGIDASEHGEAADNEISVNRLRHFS